LPTTYSPNTDAIETTIVGYLQALAYPDTSLVYTLAQAEAIKDVVDLVANGGACCEVYADLDTSDRRGFGGRVWDIQTWFILSLCAKDTPAHARQIYKVRDALVQPFQEHATLGGTVSNLFQSELQPNMKFFQVLRSGQWLRAHLAILQTKSEWQVSGGIIS